MTKPYTLHVPCLFMKPYGEILDIAAGYGQDEGRDDDWMPHSLDNAILEILMFASYASDVGVVFLPSDTPKTAAYRASIPVNLDRHPAAIRHFGRPYLPRGWRGTLDNTLMVLLNSDYSPADYWVDVDEPGLPSQHDRLRQETAVEKFQISPQSCAKGALFATWPLRPTS